MGALGLVMFAFVGTALLAGVAFFFGFSRSATIVSVDSAMSYVAASSSGIAPVGAVIATNRSSALVTCSESDLYLVIMLGDGPVVRFVRPHHVTRQRAGSYRVDFKDLGFPAFDFNGKDEDIGALLRVFEKASHNESA